MNHPLLQRISRLKGRNISEWEDECYSVEAMAIPWYAVALAAATARYATTQAEQAETPQETIERVIATKPRKITWKKK